MAKYINIIVADTDNPTVNTTTLLQKSDQDTGNISKIRISNNKFSADANNDLISIYLESDTGIKYYFIKGLKLTRAFSDSGNQAYILKDCLSFDISLYKLKIDHHTTADLTIIIT
jgi:hypothetical protein